MQMLAKLQRKTSRTLCPANPDAQRLSRGEFTQKTSPWSSASHIF